MTSGAARYPRRGPTRRRLGPTEIAVLGTPIMPVDIYVVIRRALRLDDAELINACVAGAAALAEGVPGPLAEVDCLDDAIVDATSVTKSRLLSWRKRGRQMTWDDLRVLLLGIQAQSESGAWDDPA